MPDLSRDQLFTYICDDVRFKRKDRPEVWTTVDKANGAMFRSYPLFEFVPGTQGQDEPKRYGDFVIDIDTGDLACSAAVSILAWFNEVYGVEPDQWRVYLSGKKGVHLELPDTVLGTESGHVLLPIAYKRLAKDIEGNLQVKLDTSMYNAGTGKPFRQPNVMRETGTCKRQIDYQDLYEIEDEEDYKKLCIEPGETWEPENTRTNNALSDKLQAYLEEAKKQQDIIRNAPKLTDDERDRLALHIPECVSLLANIKNCGATSATFNDVAIQLTAYAITAGKTEEEFVSGCSVFIENYPSTSLDTIAKRYENCRARYRTMAANGNVHSCGGILSLGFPGFDCKQCKSRPKGPLLSTAIMTNEDLDKTALTTQIPDSVLDPGGLISLGMEALREPGLPDIPQYNLPVVLTTIASAIAGKLTFESVWPNVFNIKIGPTSSGKTSSDKAMVDAITEAGVKDFYGVTDFASGPALLRAIADQPICMIVMDEATHIFKRYNNDPIADGKRDALLELFSKSGSILHRAYSDNKKTIIIENPCLSMTGNATTTVLDAIKQEDFDTGTLQRFDFWCYDGPTPPRGVPTKKNAKLEKFADGIKQLDMSNPAGGNLAAYTGSPLCLGITPGCLELLNAWSAEIIAKTNAELADGERGIISRKYHLSIKYAMIHYAATTPAVALNGKLDIVNLEYGKAIADILAGWKINTLREKVMTGDFHRRCELFKNSIAAVMRTGKRPTFKLLANRRHELKNWKKRESQEIIEVLEKRGEIALDESERKTAYYLVKEAE